MSTFRLPVFKRHLIVSVLLAFLLLAISACQQNDALQTPASEEVEIEKTVENLTPTEEPGETLMDEPTEESAEAPTETLQPEPAASEPVNYIFAIERLTDGVNPEYHPKWSPNGTILAYTRKDDGFNTNSIMLYTEDDGEDTRLDINLTGDFAFDWSPDGNHLVLDGYDSDERLTLFQYDFTTQEITQLIENDDRQGHPAWSPNSNTVVFARYSDLYLLDLDTMEETKLTNNEGENWHPNWSPDGTMLVFTSNRSGNDEIWTMPVDGDEATQITHNNARDDRPVWSPDGRFIAFASNRTDNWEVYIYRLSNGELIQVTDEPGFDSHPFWHPDETSLIITSDRKGQLDIWSIALPEELVGNKPQTQQTPTFEFVQLTDEETTQYHPQWSPDGKTLGYVAYQNNRSEIWLLHEDEQKAVQFPLDLNGDFAFSWSPDGTQMVFDAYDERDILAIWLMNYPDGDPVKLSDQSNGTAHPDWSPDASQVIYQTRGNLYIHDLATNELTSFLTSSAETWHPKWSPNGKNILFSSIQNGNVDLWMIPIEGGEATQITFDEAYDDRGVWSPDGKFIAFLSDRTGNDDIWLYEVSTGNLTQITTHEAIDSMPAWHPNGQSLVFASERSGHMDIWSVNISSVVGN